MRIKERWLMWALILLIVVPTVVGMALLQCGMLIDQESPGKVVVNE